MGRRKAILLISVAAGVIIATIVVMKITRAFSSSGPMPVYQGRTAREWLDQAFTTNQAAAMAAFQAMGTNALPVLVHALSDSQWDRFYGSTYSNMPIAIRKRMSVPITETTWSAAQWMLLNNQESYKVFPDLARLVADKRNRARSQIIFAIQVRPGQQYDRFIPIFIDCLTDPDPAIRSGAVTVFSRMGPAAKAATKSLTAALHDASGEVRTQAAFALWKVEGTNGNSFDAAKATLEAEMLTNSSLATIYLSYLAPEYPDIIPKLVSVMKNDQAWQAGALYALEKLGPAAKEAVPAVLELIDQPRGRMPPRVFLEALEKIDPEAARKYNEDHPDAGGR